MMVQREIAIECHLNSPDDGMYSFHVAGKIFHAEQYFEMVDYLRKEYPINGIGNKVVLDSNGLPNYLKEEVDSLKAGLQWKLNKRLEVPFVKIDKNLESELL